MTTNVILELPFPCEGAARRALLRAAYRRSAKALRDQLGYPGAALALDALAESMCTPDYAVCDDGETTVVDTSPL